MPMRLPSVLPAGTAPSGGPSRALHLVAALAAALAVALVLPGHLGLLGALVAGGAVWVRSGSWESAALRQRRAQLESDLPFVVDLMVSALAVGADPAAALREVAAAVGGVSADELAPWLARLALGADPVTVWSEMAAHPVLGRLGLTLQRAVDSGAPVVAALTRLAHDLRSRRRAEVEARVRQVEVKAAVPLGVCLLPSFVLVAVVPLVAGSVIGFLLDG
jgi:Flp pilus assembly protein TadB